jgi:hypothetical protein
MLAAVLLVAHHQLHAHSGLSLDQHKGQDEAGLKPVAW